MRLHPRHRLDIGGRDLLFALVSCVRARRAGEPAARIERARPAGALVCFSVRSAFELLLDELALEPGSEVLVSAVTHPDMPRILERHGLVPVPVDLDAATLAPLPEALERAVTNRTRALLVAHLFGGRVDLAPLAAFTAAHGLALWEDCAQALGDPDDAGDARAAASFFSFGSIKTATALGGALAYVRDADVLEGMRARQAAWPRQGRLEYAGRVLRFALLAVLGRPHVYGTAVALASRRGIDVDRLVNGSVRALRPPAGHEDEAFGCWARRQPSAPLLALLERRLARWDGERLRRRAEHGERLASALPPELQLAGHSALRRTHWVVPVLAPRADELIAALRRAGFDATRATSGMEAVGAPVDRPELRPESASRLMDELVFVPAYPELPRSELERLADVLAAWRST